MVKRKNAPGRKLAILLSLILALGLVTPFGVRADDVPDPAFSVGSQSYNSLADALASVGAGATATLIQLRDYERTGEVLIEGGRNVTIDTGPHTLTIIPRVIAVFGGGGGFIVRGASTFTVTATGVATAAALHFTIDQSQMNAVTVESNSSVIINNGIRIQSPASWSTAVRASGDSTVIINNGIVFENSGGSNITAVRTLGSANVTVHGGIAFHSSGSSAGGVDAQGESEVVIYNDIEFINTGSSSKAVQTYNSANVTVQGGIIFNSPGESFARGVDAQDQSKVTVHGGVTLNNTGTAAGGVHASGESEVKIHNGIVFENAGNQATAVQTFDSADVTVQGGILFNSHGTFARGIDAYDKSEVEIFGGITINNIGNASRGVSASHDTKITVHDGIIINRATGSIDGVSANRGTINNIPDSGGSNVVIHGGISINHADNAEAGAINGIIAGANSNITVNGDINISSDIESSFVTRGVAIGAESVGSVAGTSTVSVNGDVNVNTNVGHNRGIDASAINSSVIINGDVSVSGRGQSGSGVEVSNGGTVTVMGNVTYTVDFVANDAFGINWGGASAVRVQSSGGNVHVDGDVKMIVTHEEEVNSTAIRANGANAEVHITGDVYINTIGIKGLTGNFAVSLGSQAQVTVGSIRTPPNSNAPAFNISGGSRLTVTQEMFNHDFSRIWGANSGITIQEGATFTNDGRIEIASGSSFNINGRLINNSLITIGAPNGTFIRGEHGTITNTGYIIISSVSTLPLPPAVTNIDDRFIINPQGGTLTIGGVNFTSTLILLSGKNHPIYDLSDVPVITRQGFDFMGWFTSPHLNTWQDTQEITKTAQLGVLDAHENNSFIFAQWDGHNFNLTVNGSFAPESGAGEVKAGTFRTIHAGERDGYTFAGWTATPWASFQNANNPTTGVFMPGSDVTVTANWTSTGPVGTVINIAAIGGVTAPVAGQVPVTVITETDQFTGTVTWNGSPASFAHGTAYTATITLTPKTGFTLNGVAADFFTVSGATTVSNPANSGVVTAVFPSTAAQTYLVTVSSTGTGATSGGNFEQGATVSISAGTPPNGYQFVNWTASPAVSFADDTNPSTTFNMIGQAVTVTANFEPIPPTVTGVTVYPQTVEVEIGEKFQFSATVQGTNNPSQTVTWGVEGGDGSSSINETGELTVGPTEADGVELTVTATSTANTGVYGTATVTVTDTPPTVTVDSVTVTPPTITLDRGGYHTFSATVYGTNAPQGVTWSLNNTAGGSSINANGDLTIGANETATALTVTATSTHTASVYGTATVTVLQPVVNAQTPYITAQPQGAVYTQNDNAVPLTVTASVTDGGLLSYQWYSNTVNSTSDGTPVGTSGASFTPPTTEAGTLYYFVVITNTNDNVNGTLTAAVTSNVVAVTVNEMIVPIVYAVTYNANGGTGTMTAGSVNQGADFTIAANTFTRAGHTFAGWNTQAGGNGTAYAAGATINNVMAAITLYAQWTADPEPSPSPEPPPTSPPPPPPEPTPTPTPAPTPTTEPTPAPTPTPPPAEVTISDDAIEAITEAAEITTNQITGAVTVEIELTEEITEAIEAAVEAALEAVLDLNTYLAAAREAREAAVEAGEEYEETDAPEFITVVLNITEMFADLVDDIDTLTTVSLPVQMFETIAEAEEIGLELAMPAGTITFNPAAMASTVASAGLSQCTHISATMETLQMHDVPVEQRRNVSGSETIVRVAFMAGEEPIRNFDGYISVTVPYPGPFPAAVWMLTDNGELRRMPATYCEESQTVTFRSNSFSLFIIDAAPAATEAVYARGLLMSFTLGSPFFTLRGVMYESEVAPYAAAGRTMVPLRVIVEALGSEIEWVRATQSVIIRHEGRTLELFLDVPLYDDNGIYMGTPIAINGRTLVPLRYVMEVLLDDPDAVDWDRTNQQINIFEMIFKEEEE